MDNAHPAIRVAELTACGQRRAGATNWLKFDGPKKSPIPLKEKSKFPSY
jgi:hypothetical protein